MDVEVGTDRSLELGGITWFYSLDRQPTDLAVRQDDRLTPERSSVECEATRGRVAHRAEESLRGRTHGPT